jgi:hypothetical protein
MGVTTGRRRDGSVTIWGNAKAEVDTDKSRKLLTDIGCFCADEACKFNLLYHKKVLCLL